MQELTDAKINLLRAEAQLLKLSGADLITNNSNALIRRVCNGIGPSSFSDKARNLLDRFFPHLILPAVIHDLRWYYGKGTYDDFHSANAEFAFNAERVAWHGIAWWRVFRKFGVIWTGARFANLCDKFGWRYYCAAIRERCEWEGSAGTEVMV